MRGKSAFSKLGRRGSIIIKEMKFKIILTKSRSDINQNYSLMRRLADLPDQTKSLTFTIVIFKKSLINEAFLH
jgi:hypothetical protein